MLDDIYLDTNATTAVLPAAAQAALHVMQSGFGNPSSTHSTGLRARHTITAARQSAARAVGAQPEQMVFVSGATEAIQTAVLSALCHLRTQRETGQPTGRLLVYGATEHKAVPESLAHWNTVLGLGLELRALPVDTQGRHDIALLRAWAGDAALVCTMAANNETGVVSDLRSIEAVMRQEGLQALWLVDCVQALGKLPLQLEATRIDYAAFSGHKLHAPKGIGLLYLRSGAPFTPLMAGGGQEAGQRAGTENMAGIAAFATVLDALAEGHTFHGHAQMLPWRDRLAQSLREAFPGIVFNTPLAEALPTTLNFSVAGFSSKELLDVFDAVGVRVSAGSACSAAKALPSHVLEAMGLPAWRTASAVRMSFSPLANEAFIAQACVRIAAAGAAIRAGHLAQSGVAPARADGVVQLASGAQCTWLLLDAASRSAVLLHPQAELAERVQGTVQGLGYQLLAQWGNGAAGDGAQATPPTLPVRLGDGSSAPALRLGTQVLVHVQRDGREFYLYGNARGEFLAPEDVRFVFGPASPDTAGWQGVAGPLAVWCPDSDPQERVAAVIQPPQPPVDDAWTLQPEMFDQWLQRHPEALLVDVREPAEFHGAPPARIAGHTAVNLPMSRLADQLGGLLSEPGRPLVFVCRSGARSTRAVRCLRHSGHLHAWGLEGGLALAES